MSVEMQREEKYSVMVAPDADFRYDPSLISTFILVLTPLRDSWTFVKNFIWLDLKLLEVLGDYAKLVKKKRKKGKTACVKIPLSESCKSFENPPVKGTWPLHFSSRLLRHVREEKSCLCDYDCEEHFTARRRPHQQENREEEEHVNFRSLIDVFRAWKAEHDSQHWFTGLFYQFTDFFSHKMSEDSSKLIFLLHFLETPGGASPEQNPTRSIASGTQLSIVMVQPLFIASITYLNQTDDKN